MLTQFIQDRNSVLTIHNTQWNSIEPIKWNWLAATCFVNRPAYMQSFKFQIQTVSRCPNFKSSPLFHLKSIFFKLMDFTHLTIFVRLPKSQFEKHKIKWKITEPTKKFSTSVLPHTHQPLSFNFLEGYESNVGYSFDTCTFSVEPSVCSTGYSCHY